MILQLYDGAWGAIISGLGMHRLIYSTIGDDKNTDLIDNLIKSLEQLGTEVIGGKLEGYKLTMTSPRKQTLEIRVVAENG